MNKNMLQMTGHLCPALPLSIAFAVTDGALHADYPARWLNVRDQVRAQEARCALCGDRGSLHIAHLDSQSDRLDRANLAALCPDCRAAWDESHVMAASALTGWVRWGDDLGDAAEDAIKHVRRYGLGRLAPASDGLPGPHPSRASPSRAATHAPCASGGPLPQISF